MKKIEHALEKNKDVYYIPNFQNDSFQIEKLFKLRTLLNEYDTFNLLLFYKEFSDQPFIQKYLLENLSDFDNSQIIKDY